MWISAKTKSTVFAVITPFILIFLPSFLEGMANWLDKILRLMPSHLLEFYQNLGSFHILTIFGKVFRTLDVSIPLYLMLSVILIPMMYLECGIEPHAKRCCTGNGGLCGGRSG